MFMLFFWRILLGMSRRKLVNTIVISLLDAVFVSCCGDSMAFFVFSRQVTWRRCWLRPLSKSYTTAFGWEQ